MKFLSDLLTHPLWQGIQGVLAIVALAVSLNIESIGYKKAKKITHYFFYFFIALILISGLTTSFFTDDVFKGLFIISLFFSFLLIFSFFIARRKDKENVKRNDNPENIFKMLKRISEITRRDLTEININQWKIQYNVMSNGDDKLHETATISTNDRECYYFFKRFNFYEDVKNSIVDIKFVNTIDNTRLSYFEEERSNIGVSYAILLDPPSTKEIPFGVTIDCYRKEIWRDLIKTNEDSGDFTVSGQSDRIMFEFVAPEGRKWQALKTTPAIGVVQIEMRGAYSYATWVIENPVVRKYSYAIHLCPVDEDAGQRPNGGSRRP